jgi:hypothetical protein
MAIDCRGRTDHTSRPEPDDTDTADAVYKGISCFLSRTLLPTLRLRDSHFCDLSVCGLLEPQ